MLILLGETIVNPIWSVTEMEATLYSRIYFIKSGEVYYKDDTGTIKLKSNHLYVLPNNKPYSMWQNQRDRLNCLYIHIDIVPFILNQIIELEISANEFIEFTQKILSNIIKNNQRETAYEIAQPISEALKLYLQNENIFQIINEPIQKSLQIMSQNNSISVSRLSSEIGYSNEYFIRLFTKEIGISPKQYIINNKMKIAEKSIHNGEKISEIAKKLGYTEIRSFSRAFKHHFGVVPKNYMKYYQFNP